MPGRGPEEGDVNEHKAQLAAAARGDDEALAQLVRAYHDRVYRFGLRVCRDGYDAEDAVQDAFARLATRPDVVRDPSALSWLFTVVRNACTRMLRPFARARRALGERVEDADATPSPALDPEAALERWRLVHESRRGERTARRSRPVALHRFTPGLARHADVGRARTQREALDGVAARPARAPSVDVNTLGPQVEQHPAFPRRVNAGFMQVVDRGHIRLRVFERGAGETLSCGTGACAAVPMVSL